MTKKLIKKLALGSYSGKNLDSKKVNKITKLLKQSELKTYIKTLKRIESMHTVTVLTPASSGKDNLIEEIKSLFADKKIVVKQDKTLIAGIRIIDNDTIYDFNVQNTLENLVSYISQ